MALLVPALPSISLYGGEARQVEIQTVIREQVSSTGIQLEELFERLKAFQPADTTWVVARLIESGQARYEAKTGRFFLI